MENEDVKDTITEEHENKNKKNIFLWIISVFFILSSVVYFSTSLFPAICIGISGILLLPLIRNKMNNKLKILSTILSISLMVVFFGFLDSNQIKFNSLNSNLINITLSNENEASNNGVYTGSVVDGKRQGTGKYVWKDGTTYEGNWNNNVMEGNGKLTTPDGDIYEGNFENGKKNGKGKYNFSNGDIYEGEFKNDIMNGTGKYTFADGDTYEGEFSNNKFNGNGTYTKDGIKYTGTWDDNKYNQ